MVIRFESNSSFVYIKRIFNYQNLMLVKFENLNFLLQYTLQPRILFSIIFIDTLTLVAPEIVYTTLEETYTDCFRQFVT